MTTVAAAEAAVELTPQGLAYVLAHGREAIERRIDRHLALVTALLGILDTQDGDENLEPSFGSDALEGGDVQDEPHDADSDDEPSLGWTDVEGRYGSHLSFDPDRELDTSDDEPSLGSPEIPPQTLVHGGPHGWWWRQGNQERWAVGARNDGEEDAGDAPEEVNEDGGDILDQPHDEEPDREYSAGVDSADGMTTQWTPEHPDEEVVHDRDFTPISTKHRDRRRAHRATPPAPGAGLFHGQSVAHLPKRYVMRVVGDCLDPEILDGSRLEFSSTERPSSGDFVAIYRRAQFVKPGEWQVVVKRLVTDWRGGDVTPVILRGGKMIPLGECVEAEMLNPPRRLYYPAEQIEAMHKMVRVLPDDAPTDIVSAADLPADAARALAASKAVRT